MSSEAVSPIQQCLNRLRDGGASARGELLRVSRDRLLLMTRKMLRGYPGVGRWEETDDVLQNVLVRLDGCLAQLPLDSPRDFLRLAAAEIRRELIDLARRYAGPEGLGAHHLSPGPTVPVEEVMDQAALEAHRDREHLARWTALHEQIAQLPDEQREAFDLLWYHGMSADEAAALLIVSVSTVRRRWQAARLRLAEAFAGELPPD